MVPIEPVYAETKGLINFTFGKKYDGAALANPETPEYWNSLYSSKSNPVDRLKTLFDASNRLISGASIQWSYDDFTVIGDASSFKSTSYQELMKHYDVTSNQGVITLEGLEPGTYDLHLYSQVQDKAEWQTLSVNVNYQTYTTKKPDTVPNDFIEGTNYLLANVSTDESGVLTFEYAPGKDSKVGVINAFQLQYTGPLELTGGGDVTGTVPEPSSTVLLMTGLVTAALR
ncbi:MAG: PEP-CTERM sorting domain-containing protein, partial [Chlorobiaceae bacterium]|nr:PEP-CTERM sorting domain-containing protein [Chlorobiaceae bacterium]